MADYTLNGGDSTNFTGSYELTQRTGTKFTFDTDAKYLKQDIEFTVSAKSATPKFDGGGVTGTPSGSYTNATISTTDTSGVKVVSSATYNRAAVLYNGAVNGWVTKADNAATEVTALSNKTLGTAETKYITGVDIKASKNFNITIPNGESTVTLNFAVDANGNVVVT